MFVCVWVQYIKKVDQVSYSQETMKMPTVSPFPAFNKATSPRMQKKTPILLYSDSNYYSSLYL